MTALARSAVETMRVRFGDRAQDESQNPDRTIIEEYRRFLLNRLNVTAAAMQRLEELRRTAAG